MITAQLDDSQKPANAKSAPSVKERVITSFSTVNSITGIIWNNECNQIWNNISNDFSMAVLIEFVCVFVSEPTSALPDF